MPKIRKILRILFANSSSFGGAESSMVEMETLASEWMAAEGIHPL
jgi:hypothetical protein